MKSLLNLKPGQRGTKHLVERWRSAALSLRCGAQHEAKDGGNR
jgi:hypothetical protein